MTKKVILRKASSLQGRKASEIIVDDFHEEVGGLVANVKEGDKIADIVNDDTQEKISVWYSKKLASSRITTTIRAPKNYTIIRGENAKE